MFYAHREPLPYLLCRELAGLLVQPLSVHPHLEPGPQSAEHRPIDYRSSELLYEVQDERRLAGTVGVDVAGERIESRPGRCREDAVVQDAVTVVEQGVNEVGSSPTLASSEVRDHPADTLPVKRRTS